MTPLVLVFAAVVVIGLCAVVRAARLWALLLAVGVAGLLITGAVHVGVRNPVARAAVTRRPPARHPRHPSRVQRSKGHAHKGLRRPPSTGHITAASLNCHPQQLIRYLNAHHLQDVAGLIQADYGLTHAALSVAGRGHCQR